MALTFVHGFLLGQAFVIVVALLALRYVLFEDTHSALRKSDEQRRRRAYRLAARAGRPISPPHAHADEERRHAERKLAAAAAGATSSARQRKRAAGAGGGVGVGGGGGVDGVAASSIAAITSAILESTGYDLGTHPSEPADWLNVLFAMAFAGYREDILRGGHDRTDELPDPPPHLASARTGVAREAARGAHQDHELSDDLRRTAKGWIERILNNQTVGRGVDFLDPIEVHEFDFGKEFPIFSNVRVRPADDHGRIRVEVDVDYADSISLAIETKLVINMPRPRFAVLPMSLGLVVERFSGTLALELFSTEPSSHSPTTSASGTAGTGAPAAAAAAATAPQRSRHELHVSLHPDFSLEARATSLLGSRAKLQDVPKVEQLLVGRLRGWVHDRFVWPRYWMVALPNLAPVPRSPAAAAAAEAAAASGEKLGARGTTRTMQQPNGRGGRVVDASSSADGFVRERETTVAGGAPGRRLARTTSAPATRTAAAPVPTLGAANGVRPTLLGEEGEVDDDGADAAVDALGLDELSHIPGGLPVAVDEARRRNGGGSASLATGGRRRTTMGGAQDVAVGAGASEAEGVVGASSAVEAWRHDAAAWGAPGVAPRTTAAAAATGGVGSSNAPTSPSTHPAPPAPTLRHRASQPLRPTASAGGVSR